MCLKLKILHKYGHYLHLVSQLLKDELNHPKYCWKLFANKKSKTSCKCLIFNTPAWIRWFYQNQSNSNLVMVGCACIERYFGYADSTLRKFLLSLVHFFNQDWIHNLSTFHFTKEVSFPETNATMSFPLIDAMIPTSVFSNPVKTLCELAQTLLHSLFWVILRPISFIPTLTTSKKQKIASKTRRTKKVFFSSFQFFHSLFAFKHLRSKQTSNIFIWNR